MSRFPGFEIDDKWILSHRGKKNPVDPSKPYAWLTEKERSVSGRIEEVLTIFLSNRECPFHCLMCDLWKNTTDYSVPENTIPNQIEWALTNSPSSKHLKLYNSGSFFDRKAIPEQDYEKIASLLDSFETVIVESHPGFINKKYLRFRDMLKPELQVAIGLETVHPEVLKKLNKHMSLEDFDNSVKFLNHHKIPSRAFILLRPPFLSEQEGVYWANQSLDFAFKTGIECCIIIPTRAGNGALDLLNDKNYFSPPDIQSLEKVIEYGIQLNAGRVFSDLWDIDLFSSCDNCIDQRRSRLVKMNLYQKRIAPVKCTCDY
ncbi:MAG: hypothetical protein K8R53_01330 [Bacteroidales bacterium]|nr:hypothetical protein [Bacteroidales bacterium]